MVAMESNANNEVLEAGSTEKDASQAVQVAVHIRPLIAQERIQGCKECISVVPGEPQIQLGVHAFTFDHVYGSIAAPPANIFDQCVLPLVEGLFQGYNATVLAYGQTGSGKTYTMGTGYTVGGSTEGIIPRVMDTIFKKIQSLKDKSEFQLRVSFIEILKEEIHDLLDPNPPAKTEAFNGGGGAKALPLTKPPIQIRETGNGGITLAGVSEIDVSSLGEMANCLEQGSLCRATGSTNMNSRSSRSHAIFTINVEQRRKWDAFLSGDNALPEDTTEDFLCAKLHLVDLAGSERAKRTGADGNRFKEGVHINRGLLALGNVISALGDDKKRKEGGHVPYRDSKLTRLLQDSLGGNSRTVMLACVSPADSNAEETLNTLKYANRARNIQNKPTVNRDPMAAEMQRMRHQLEIMQAELLCARATGSSEEIQILKQKIAWLESSNFELRQELQHFHASATTFSQQALEAQLERDKLRLKFEKIRSGNALAEDDEDDRNGMDLVQSYLTKIQGLEHELQRTQVSRSNLPDIERTASALSCLSLGSTASELTTAAKLDGLSEDMTSEADVDAVVVKEIEHNMLQDCLDKELQELNQRLEQKEAEMKSFVKSDTLVLKQHFEKKLVEMEEEKKTLQKERDTLLKELEALSSSSDEQAHKMQETYKQKLNALEHQISELKKKQENQAQLLRQKQRSDEAAKRLQEDILRIKQQKVQLQNKIKQESEQFRQWKTAREKEVLQLRKEGRKNEYEMHKLQALHQRQKMVLQRKTEEAAIATKRLKELLEARKISSRETAQGMGSGNGAHGQNSEKALQQWLDQELEVAVRVHEVRSAYEKESHSRAAFAKELAELKQEEETPQAITIPMQFDQNGSPLSALQRASNSPMPSMSPSARRARIRWLESMINASSTDLVAMASQLSEAEERERSFSGRARWQHLRTMGDMKNMLNLAFNAARDTRCQLRDKEVEVGEINEKIAEVTEALRQSEIQRKEFERRQHIGEKAVAVVLATTTKDGSEVAIKRGMEELSGGHARQRLCKDDICDLSETNGIPYHLRKGSRHSNFYKADESDDSESIESDTDMDVSEVDLSDEDWLEEEEKPAARSRAQLMKAGKKSVVGGRKSSMSSIGSQQQESTEEKQRSGISSETVEEIGERLHVKCCSCSTTSGCKTKKCECKAAGSLCGTSCTCKAGKCANREISDMAFDSSEILNVDNQTNERSNSVTGADVIEGKLVEVIYKPEQMLARHGAKLLDRAWKEEIHVIDAGLSSALSQASSGSEDSDMPQRHPLSDIGNKKKVTSNQQNKKPMKKQKLQKTLIQIVPVPRQINAENNPKAVGRHVDAEHLATPLHSASSLPPATSINAQEASNARNERPPSGQVQPVQMMANAILPSSPLRARNRHRSGVNGSVANKRIGGGAGSPEKSVDKENLR